LLTGLYKTHNGVLLTAQHAAADFPTWARCAATRLQDFWYGSGHLPQ